MSKNVNEDELSNLVVTLNSICWTRHASWPPSSSIRACLQATMLENLSKGIMRASWDCLVLLPAVNLNKLGEGEVA